MRSTDRLDAALVQWGYEDSVAAERSIVYSYLGIANGSRRIRFVVAVLGVLLLAGITGLGQDGLQDADIQVTRQISAYHALPESTFVVTLRLAASEDLVGVGISEVIPRGWIIDPVQNDGAAFKRSDNEWVFGEKIRAGGTRELVYEVSIPSAEQLVGVQLPACFSIEGTVQARTPRIEVPIIGETLIEVGSVLPIPSAVAHLMAQTGDAPDSIDLRMSKRISEDQLARALQLWQAGIPVPDTGGRTIDLAMMELLVGYYETCTPVDLPLPLAGEGGLVAVRTLNTFLPCDSVLLPEGCRDPGVNARRVSVAVTITAEYDAYGVGLSEWLPEGWRVTAVEHEGLWFRGATAEWIYPRRLAAGDTIQVLYEVEVATSEADTLYLATGCCGWDATISGEVSSALACGDWEVAGEELVHVWDCLPVILAISRWDTEADGLDATLSDFISFSQLQRAVAFWLEGGVVPHTCGFKVGYETLKMITGHWLTHTPVTQNLPDAPAGPCDDVDAGCYVPAGSCGWFCTMRDQQPQEDFVSVPVVAPPIADAGPDGTLTCSVREVTLEGAASAGAPPYVYEWIDPRGKLIADTPSTDVGIPGTYVLVVTGSNGCSASDSVVVSEDVAAPEVDAGPDQLVTCAVQHVTLAATVTGGTPPFAYSWQDPRGELIGTRADVDVSAPGTYTVTVTGGNGCSETDSVDVMQDVEAPQVSASCGGVLTCVNPQVTLGATATGGTTPYIYAWQNSRGERIATTTSVDVNAPGTYTVTVTGSNGCSRSGTVVVTQDITAPVVNATSDGALTCANAQVILRAVVTSGSGPYVYAWQDPRGASIGTAASVDVSTPGTYTVTVTGSNGCTGSGTVIVTEDYEPPTVSATSDGMLTCANPRVTLTAAVTRGDGPYVYAWQGPGGVSIGTTASVDVSASGTYTVTVTGSNGCPGSGTVVVTQDVEAPVASATSDGILTCANPQVTLMAAVTGGRGPFSYAWRDLGGASIGTAASVDVSAPGTYTVTVTGGNGCSGNATVTVTQDVAAPTVSATSDGILTCANPQVTLTAAVTGGRGPFSYVWQNESGVSVGTAASVDVSTPGTYTVTATGENGCPGTDTVEVMQDMTAPEVSAASDGIPVLTCSNPQVTLTAAVTQGSGPFSYTWEDAAGDIVGNQCDLVVEAPGTYTVTVTGESGCPGNGTVVVTQDVEAPQVSAICGEALTCANPQVTLMAAVMQGTGPFCYTWQNAAGEMLGDERDLAVETAGTYAVTVTGSNGCQGSATVEVTQDLETPEVSVTSDGIPVLTCANPQLTLTATITEGRGPFGYTWQNTAGEILGDQSDLTVETADTYTVTVTGATGCPGSAMVEVKQDLEAPEVSVASDGIPALTCSNAQVTLTAAVIGASGPFSYVWVDASEKRIATTESVDVNAPGTYTVTVTGATGCPGSATAEVTQDVEAPEVDATSDGVPVLTCSNTQVTLTAAVTGGREPFSYVWVDAFEKRIATTASANVSTPGIYTVTVTGSNGCSGSDTVMVTQDLEPPGVEAVSGGTLTCSNTQVTLTAAVTGGGGPFSYVWADACGEPIATTASVDVSTPGIYTVTVTGESGCSGSDTVMVIQDMEPPDVKVTSGGALTCTNQQVTLTAAVTGGGGPFSYVWVDAFGKPIATTASVDVSTPGMYRVTVTGSNGCSGCDTVRVTQDLDPPVVETGEDQGLTCASTEVLLDITVSGGTPPFEYVWIDDCGEEIAVTEDVTVTLPGMYTVLVTGANGCSALGCIAVLNEVAPPIVDAGPDQTLTCKTCEVLLDATVGGGTAPYEYTWTDACGAVVGRTEDVHVTQPSVYTLLVKTADGCVASDSVTVIQDTP